MAGGRSRVTSRTAPSRRVRTALMHSPPEVTTSASHAQAPSAVTINGLISSSTSSGHVEHQLGHLCDDGDQPVEVGGRRTPVPGEQRGAAQAEQGPADLGRVDRQQQVGDVAHQLGQHAADAQAEHRPEHRVGLHADQQLGDPVGHEPLDQHRREPGQQLGGGRPHVGRVDQAEPDGVLVGLVGDAERPSPRPGHARSAAATTAAPGLAHTAPSGTGTPFGRGAAACPVASLSTRRRRRTAPASGLATGGAGGPAQARPMQAAASIASIATAGGASTASPAGPRRPPARRPGSPAIAATSAPRASAAAQAWANASTASRPVVVGAAVGPRQVGEEQVQVRRAADHGREGAAIASGSPQT